MNNARELAADLLRLLRREQGAMADFLVALATFDERRAWAELGYASLFHFLHRELGMSKGAAHYRKTAAAPHRTVVTAMPSALLTRQEVVRASVEGVQSVELALPAPVAVQPVAPRTVAEPLTADLRRLHVTVSKRFMEKLEAARDALSHSNPGADTEAILEAGLDLLLERAAKRRGCTRPKAETVAPKERLDGEGRGRSEQPTQQSKNPRFIPAAVKREVWLRDSARCQFRLENGELCGATHRLQFDHVRPVALGGESTASNIRLACAPHNLLAARRVFGDVLMNRYAPTRNAGAQSEPR